MIRKVSKQVVQRVSSLVARHELFERQGERPVQPPLPPDAWSGGSEAATVEGPANEDDDDPTCRVSDADDIVALLKSGPMVVNHWATWCESCMADRHCGWCGKTGTCSTDFKKTPVDRTGRCMGGWCAHGCFL